MPETEVETTGIPIAIASARTFGMPSRSPSATMRGDKAKMSGFLIESRSDRHGSWRPAMPPVPPGLAGDFGLETRPQRPLADDGAPKAYAPIPQDVAGGNEIGEALLGH